MALDGGVIIENRYRVEALLGQGGMGAVYRAWDLRLQVPVALKEMLAQPELDARTLEQLRQQFEQEAIILARLKHPHLVRVSDFFERDGNAYLVMDYVEGENLAARIARQGAQPESQIRVWAAQLLDALIYCHGQGIMHRDIKPQNLIIQPDGRAVLVDFGLVKLWDPQDPRTKTAMRGMGTPEYAPPEQYDQRIGHTDPRSDLYGLGATLYHALTGTAPPSATQRVASLNAFKPPRAFNPTISLQMETLVLRAMALPVEHRFPSAQAMLAAVRGATSLPETLPPPIQGKGHTQVMPGIRPPPAPPAHKNRPKLRLPAAWPVVLVVGLIVFMCLALFSQALPPASPKPDGTPTASATAPPTLNATPRPTATPLPPTPTPITLRISTCCPNDTFGNLDPIHTAWGVIPQQVVSEAFVGLTRQNETTAYTEPGMAHRWDTSEDFRVWTFHLRPDVPWVSYNPETHQVELVRDEAGNTRYVTADDFAYGIWRMLAPENSSAYRETLAPIVGVRPFLAAEGPPEAIAVEPLDEVTLRITLQEPAAYFDVIADMWIVAQPRWQVEAYPDRWATEGHFQGYGPYVLKASVPNAHLTLIKNPYWPGTEAVPIPTIEEITWLLEAEPVTRARYQRQEIELASVNDWDLWQNLLTAPNFSAQIDHAMLLCTYYYGFNVTQAPFHDVRVRRAFALALDRDRLTAAAAPTHAPARWFTSPGLRDAPPHDAPGAFGATYDPEKARLLLNEAYPDRAQLPPITLAYWNSSLHTNIAQLAGEMWQEVLDVNVILAPISNIGDYYAQLEDNAPQIWRMGNCADFYDAQALLGLHTKAQASYILRTSHWTDVEFSELLTTAAQTPQGPPRAALFARAEEILVKEQAVVIPIYWYGHVSLVQPYVLRPDSQLGLIERLEKWELLTP